MPVPDFDSVDDSGFAYTRAQKRRQRIDWVALWRHRFPAMADNPSAETGEEMEEAAEVIAKEILESFKEEWGQAMEVLEEAQEAFDDVEGLIDGPQGFDLSLRCVVMGRG